MIFAYDRVIVNCYSIDEDKMMEILCGIKTGIEYWGKIKITDDDGSLSSFEIATIINDILEHDGSIIIISSKDDKEFTMTKNDFLSGIKSIIDSGTWDALTQDPYNLDCGFLYPCLEENAKYIADSIIQSALFKNESHYTRWEEMKCTF